MASPDGSGNREQRGNVSMTTPVEQIIRRGS
jgi:hypothetical protein